MDRFRQPLPSALMLALLLPAAAAASTVVDIRVSGNERTETPTIFREMQTCVGDTYDAAVVRADRDRIDNLDLFSEVTIDTLHARGGVVLDVRVKERLVWIPTEWIPYPVLEWDPEVGWSYGAGVTNPNQSGRNRRVSALLQGGGERRASLGVSDPWVFGNHVSISLDVSYRAYDDYEALSNRWISGGVSVGSWIGLTGRVSLSATAAEIETDAWRTASGNRTDRLRTVSLLLARDTRDLYLDPRSGGLARLQVTGHGKVLGGTVDYVSWQADLTRYGSIRPGHTLALRGAVVYRDAPVPDYRGLRLGGFSTVRGLDPGGGKGRNRVLGSIEYRWAVKERESYDVWFIRNVDLGLMLAVFADAGTVWDERRGPHPEDVFGSAGAGLRILSQQIFRLEAAVSRRDGVRWIAATGMPF